MILEKQITELFDLIQRSRRIVFFGGAGVSTAAGIPDFRSADGLYASRYGGRNPEDILSAMFFALHTDEFYNFYRKVMLHPEVEPCAVHRVLYELERQDKLRGIVTQNIDALHRRAGNIRLYELHGSVDENYCVDCEASYPLSAILDSDGAPSYVSQDVAPTHPAQNGVPDLPGQSSVPHCPKCGGIIKPYVVLYDEPLDKYTCIGAQREISNADLLIVAGTSLSVEPAASFIDYYQGKELVVINNEPTPADERATLLIRDDINTVFEEIEKMLKS